MALNGLEGFFEVARIIGEKFGRDSEAWESESMLDTAIDEFGRKAVLDRLANEAKTNQDLKRYRDEVLPRLCERQKKSSSYKAQSLEERRRGLGLTFEELLQKIENAEGQYPSQFMRFGTLATDEEIASVLSKMELEQRTDQLIRYAWFFSRRYRSDRETMPEKLILILLAILKSENIPLVDAAAFALSAIDDQRVRDAGVQILQNPMFKGSSIPLQLITRSVKQDDSPLIAAFVENLSEDTDKK